MDLIIGDFMTSVPRKIFILSLLYSLSVYAKNLEANRRVFFNEKRPVFHQVTDRLTAGYSQPVVVGAGTILAMYADGSALFRADLKENNSPIKIKLTKSQVEFLQLSADCPFVSKQIYSTEKYNAVNGNGYKHSPIGLVLATEAFGDCKSGFVTIKSSAVEAPRFVSAFTVLAPNLCASNSLRGHSSASYLACVGRGCEKRQHGTGTAIQTYGDCSRGVIEFRPDHNSQNPVIIDAPSFSAEVKYIPATQTKAVRPPAQ